MAKKTNTRPKAKAAPRPPKIAAKPLDSVVETPAVETPSVPRAPRPVKQTRSQAASERLEDEYSYISGDLWRVFILAAAMFALLIALNVVFSLIS
jgi:hypothetical protein